MKKIALFLAVLALPLFWSCHTESSDEDTPIDVRGDSSWLNYQRVVVLLLSPSGAVIDTLFQDSLRSLDDLKGLRAPGYQGGEARFVIRGYDDGALVHEEVW